LALSQLRFRFPPRRIFPMTACLLAIVGVQPVFAQAVDPPPAKRKFTPSTDFSLGVFGQLTPVRTPIRTTPGFDGVEIMQTTQGVSPSAGVLATVHQSFKPWLGYNLNFGYSRFTENYSYGSAFISNAITKPPQNSYFSQLSIGTNMYELTIAPVIQGPKTKHFSTFAQFGGGGLWFLPTQAASPYNEQVRAAMVFGAGLNYKLTDHLGVRAEYRGLFYKNPDFAYRSGQAPMSKLFTVTNEPTVSVVYTFGGAKKRDDAKKY
jgi:opacity protein-like surface antigen